ncbi:hypothetical protein TTHERM_00149010 (macronuclear) [Tetrahymena thermophila SB210]|uniref:Uncharacterized protein n=1 Tax=Tetrahymena thermophila (strain SB210) TaxID=312017 RepID=I7LWB0_TETTS|nr:hypothetical protein TTHERM_00149010 [Tetrahymena thermophila SB210]EAS01291.2 hypothetical protein TTHERM_00149010 [Tetrahymena thermophila SB210]|eukprot:XP_001021536.2 hypothetical protein TTHERM_00149010 [Tetrahymena thermophila SB210]
MSTSNIEYLDSKVQQMNLATFSEEQISFQLDKSRVVELESENNTLKLQMKTKEQSWNKDRAILTQKIELLESHIHESKIRQENLQKMNEAFMTTLNDLTANPKNFSNKMLKELQQLFENRISMDPDTESKLQKSALTIKQQQEEIEDLKKKITQYEQEIQFLRMKLSENEKIIENSLSRQQQDLAMLSQEKEKENKKIIEKENAKIKQMYEKEMLSLQKKYQDALNQIAQNQQGRSYQEQEQDNDEISRLNSIIDSMTQNHKLEIELIRQQTSNEIKNMENKQKQIEQNSLTLSANKQEPNALLQKIQQLEEEKSTLSSQLQSVITKFQQISNQNSGINAALQLKESQIEDLKTKMAQLQANLPLTSQDFFDVELQISRIEPERSKRRSIVNESIISNMTPMNRDNNQPSLNIFGNSLGFNGLANDNGLSNNASINSFAQNSQNTLQVCQIDSAMNNGNGNIIYQTPSMGNQIPYYQSNYSSVQSQNQNIIPQGFGLTQSIQFNNINNNGNQRIEQQKTSANQQFAFMRQGSLASSELSNCDTFGNPSAVKNKRVISASTSSSNLVKDFIHSNGNGGIQVLDMNAQNFLKTDQSTQSQNSHHQQQITMDTSIEKRQCKAGQITSKKKLQSIENIESQASLHNLKTEDTVIKRERTTTTSASYHSGAGNSHSLTNIMQFKNGSSELQFQKGIHQELTNKALTLQQIQMQKKQNNQNLRNQSLNPSKSTESQQQNQHLKLQHNKNQSLSNNNIPMSTNELKKSIIESSNITNTTQNNISQCNLNYYNSNQSIISQSNLLGGSQSFIKSNPMSQSSLLNQEQSFLVKAIQENMQERMTLEEKMKNLETEVQNYIMINQQKQKGSLTSASSFSQLVQQVMKELYSKQLNKSIFQLSKEERERVLKQEIKALVDKIMIKPLQQRQQSQENKSIIINQTLNKSLSIEDGIMRESKSPRYNQSSTNIGVSNILNSSSLSFSQNKGQLKSNSNLLSRIQVKPNSVTNIQSQSLGVDVSTFFEKKSNQFNLNGSQSRNNRILN